MPLRSMKTVFTAGVIVLVAAAGASVAGFHLSAQEEPSAEIVVGTYQPQAVAQAVGLQQQTQQAMQGLQARAQQAQQIQQDATNQFLQDLQAVMPEVAEETGSVAIASEVVYTAPGVSTQDVTGNVIEAMGVELPAAPEGEIGPPAGN